MKFEDGNIHGVEVKELKKHNDKRGWLAELFRNDELDERSLPAMAYLSMTEPGVSRGPHEHRDQADLFCFVGPSTFRVYLWDNRKESPTFGKKMIVEGGEGRPVSLQVPAGVVHAYKNIGAIPGWVLNFPNRLYGGKGRKEPVDEVRHENNPNTIFTLD